MPLSSHQIVDDDHRVVEVWCQDLDASGGAIARDEGCPAASGTCAACGQPIMVRWRESAAVVDV